MLAEVCYNLGASNHKICLELGMVSNYFTTAVVLDILNSISCSDIKKDILSFFFNFVNVYGI